MKGESKERSNRSAKQGYYLYEDGVSHWGIGIYRDGTAGVEIPKDLHEKSQEEKAEWYKENAAAKAGEKTEEKEEVHAKKK